MRSRPDFHSHIAVSTLSAMVVFLVSWTAFAQTDHSSPVPNVPVFIEDTESISSSQSQPDPYAPVFIGDREPAENVLPEEDAYEPVYSGGIEPLGEVRSKPVPDWQPPPTISRFELFLQSSFLWKAPIFVSTVAALILGLVGIYVVLRRIVFVTACLANVSGVGVALGLLFGLESQTSSSMAGGQAWYQDIIGLFGFSLLITSVAAAGFAWWRESKRMSSESLLGVAYLVSASLLVILASQLNQATHDIDDIVFGSAVVVEHSQLIIVPLFAGLLLLVHLVLRRDFLFISFDPITAKALKHPVRKLDMVLLVTIGLAIAIATRAIGALPVFSLIVLPPLTALLITDRMGLVFLLAPILGALAAAGGYFAAFMLAWPVGPTMTLCCAGLLVLAGARGLLRRFVGQT